MSKKIMSLLLVLTLVFSIALTGCGNQNQNTTPEQTTEETGEKTEGSTDQKPAEPVKVGMVTDSGTIDDKSFNQGTWEGIVKYAQDNAGVIEEKYLQPSGEQHTDYLNAMNDLIDTGHTIIVTPGFKFETAVNEAATNNPDVSFILIDGQTHNGDGNFVKHDNTVCVFFNEHEAGFLAGVAAALSTKTNKLGFIGGMEIPPVQKFGWGYQAGVAYANKTYGTQAEIVDYIYQGTFDDVAGGQTLAAGMYDKGVDIIFHAAGGVGVGVFNEAKERAEKGQEVYVIGVDVDQYEAGKISSGKSVTLTSAVKGVDTAAYNYIDAKLNGTFPGGEVVTLGLKDNAVGLPKENPNLSEDTIKKVEETVQQVLDGKLTIPATQEELDAFLK
ncbi:BMP family lipoprotein [Defluviitalea raffinosedens]|jgi:basic membrane protein A|uniref:BMP family ABC transporter substrate-binding protein n=1 Tax=Defluviitalea raffinosedens TaxID=1450156 RepID=A0A7C8HDF0_9FIRM|nr:BMP family ABC transporter substrate-binding protein [Defluviitalea raffinosedens]KAE9630265.1 BMP family ABC transporter substrate-binding protein [Defluviitalea raffinosedens]MBM7686068.1 basic membrane protein A [Defluviitalea raffinosedens]HHW67685.1 BMP family ABC transporter substrate-binding protein [Candidatus Epulonipiscium sp.]